MRHEHDVEADIHRTIFSDEPIVRTFEHELLGARHVVHLDANGQIVQTEVYGLSKMNERQAQTVRKEFKAEVGRTEIIGSLDWTITECATGTILAQGRTEPALGEVSINTLEGPDGILAMKQFPLTDGFTFGVSTGLTDNMGLIGFALVARRTDERSFCWEWFNVDNERHAKKIQETGELAVVTDNPNGQWQIVRTEFLTDVSIRVMQRQEDGSGEDGPDMTPTWRVLVRRGSWVNWPSLVNGVVTPTTGRS